MPFDGIADPVAAKSLQALELMEDRLQGGRKWTHHFMFRDGGKMCLLGASYFGCNIGAGSQGDRALEYLARAITPESRAKDWSDRCWVETTIADFNDSCAGLHLLRQVSSESRTAVLAVTHHQRLIGEVDRVITMMDGRIAEPNGLKPGPEARIGETFPPIPANH
jgi:hypothetical protein